MTSNFIFIHSTGGNPSECWYPWLETELKNKGCKVMSPSFPTPEGQTLNNWLNAFEPYWNKINENTVLVGRSIGAPFVLSLLERINVRIKAAFLVAGFASDIGRPEFNDYIDTFVENPFDWQKIRNNCEQFFVYHAEDDPIVDLKYGKELAKQLNTKLILVKDGGHFNIGTKFGYKFKNILEDINRIP
ncbi:MAG: alpha/beta hydrolase [archaeon]